MAKSVDTGPPSEYDDNDAAELEAAVDDAWAEYESSGGGGEPTKMKVSAQIEWNGVTDRRNDGHRTTRLEGLDLQKVKAELDKAREARPATSRRAVGWHAQIRELSETKYGSKAADRAGLNPTARTMRNWLSESQTPSKANREKIASAYEALKMRRVDQASHRVADAVSGSIRDSYRGSPEVRLRNITDMELED
jgi:hypothetical protein